MHSVMLSSHAGRSARPPPPQSLLTSSTEIRCALGRSELRFAPAGRACTRRPLYRDIR
jgi:hypothetical protein